MAAPIVTPFHVGELKYAAYKFLKKDDTLPMHTHTKRDVHTCIVARGSFRCHGPVIGEIILKCGDHADFPDDVTHELIALEDNSLLYHHRKYPSL